MMRLVCQRTRTSHMSKEPTSHQNSQSLFAKHLQSRDLLQTRPSQSPSILCSKAAHAYQDVNPATSSHIKQLFHSSRVRPSSPPRINSPRAKPSHIPALRKKMAQPSGSNVVPKVWVAVNRPYVGQPGSGSSNFIGNRPVDNWFLGGSGGDPWNGVSMVTVPAGGAARQAGWQTGASNGWSARAAAGSPGNTVGRG